MVNDTSLICIFSSAWPLQWRHDERDSISNHQPHDCLLNRLFRRRSPKTSKLRVTGLCAGNSPETGAYYAENVSIWWRHHDINAVIIVAADGLAINDAGPSAGTVITKSYPRFLYVVADYGWCFRNLIGKDDVIQNDRIDHTYRTALRVILRTIDFSTLNRMIDLFCYIFNVLGVSVKGRLEVVILNRTVDLNITFR